MHIATDNESTHEEHCAHCGAQFTRIYGTLLNDTGRLGVYFADLHADDGGAIVVVGTMQPEPSGEGFEKRAAALRVWADDDQYHSQAVDGAQLSAIEKLDMGRPFTREEILASPIREHLFHLVDKVLVQDERLKKHLG